MTPKDALAARLRRYRKGIECVRDTAAHQSAGDDVPDALAAALNSLWDLIEGMWPGAGASLDQLLEGDPGGEAVVALVCARGAQTHRLVDFGDLHAFGTHGFGEGPFGGGWVWQPFVEDRPRYQQRWTWYCHHIQGRPVMEPLDEALAWLTNRPELALNVSDT